jgi:hypothetical protein
VLVVGAVGVGVVDEVGRRADLVVDADVSRLLDSGCGDLVGLRSTHCIRKRGKGGSRIMFTVLQYIASQPGPCEYQER